jgi:type VI secretion system protein ImpK
MQIANGGVFDESNPESLLAVYETFLTGVVRIQAGRQRLGDAAAALTRWRGVLKSSLQQQAAKGRYTADEIEDARLAVIVFLDEAIQHSSDPAKEDWRLNTLQFSEYGKTIGGQVFYERLERMERRPDTEGLADLLELYYMCLLLGYEGRYDRAERSIIMARIRERLERRRPAPAKFGIPAAGEVRIPEDRTAVMTRRAALGSVCCAAAAAAAFVIFKILLITHADSLMNRRHP